MNGYLSHKPVPMVNSSTVTVVQGRDQLEFFIEFCGRMEINMHRFYNQHESCLFKLFVGNSEAAEHLHAALLEVVEVLRIVDSSLPIDLAVSNANT